ncbi:MAG TPA: DUF5777 family beta-barrel protein [Chitinophagaceae bacterium]|nr:DUF5777 family beta-barrel protein [Chitinophagaceae bacterium]
MRKIILIASGVFISTSLLQAQDESLLKDLETETPKKEYITNAFKSSRVINGHSMELIGKGVLDFRILHRFGTVNQGVNELFGLDDASMRMGFDYGLGKNLTIGIGRTTFKKELDGFVKWRAVRQAVGGSPFSWVLVTGMSVFTFKNTDPQKEISFSSRAGYYYQSIFGRKFTEKFSLQLSPTLVHRNEVEAGDVNDIWSLGIGGRLKVSKRTAVVIDYFPVLNHPKNSTNKDAVSIGFDIETGGHVFQLHFSNTTGMNERAFITDTQNSWGKGEIRFGFNLSRVFTIKRNLHSQ